MRVAAPGKWNATLSQADRQRWGRHGSKLVAVARTITDVVEADASAALIVFVQWASLQAKIGKRRMQTDPPTPPTTPASVCEGVLGLARPAGTRRRVHLLRSPALLHSPSIGIRAGRWCAPCWS